jgi:hypothetical protein
MLRSADGQMESDVFSECGTVVVPQRAAFVGASAAHGAWVYDGPVVHQSRQGEWDFVKAVGANRIPQVTNNKRQKDHG